MYIDKFICIQIGPSEQKQTHTTLMSEFMENNIRTRTVKDSPYADS